MSHEGTHVSQVTASTARNFEIRRKKKRLPFDRTIHFWIDVVEDCAAASRPRRPVGSWKRFEEQEERNGFAEIVTVFDDGAACLGARRMLGLGW
jgi:hypothetical protein